MKTKEIKAHLGRVLLTALAFSTVAASAAEFTVPGTADPWLAGMPDGSTASLGDVAPAQSPVLAAGFSLAPGSFLRFFGTGGVAFDPTSPVSPPDGVIVDHHHSGAENGMSDVTAPADALMAVFLGPLQPSLSGAPGSLDFSTTVSRDYVTLSPMVQQVFFIGDGLTSGGVRQQIEIPVGATRLFLGGMDGEGWYNNIGSFSVTVVPEPHTLTLVTLGIGAFLFRLRKADHI